MANSLLSERQWFWVADRIQERYQIRELATFLGLHRDTIYRNLIRIGVCKPREELPPLDERRQEFQTLAAAGEDYQAWKEKMRQAQ